MFVQVDPFPVHANPRLPIWRPILTFLVVSAAMSPLLALVQDRCGLDPETLRLTQFSTLVGAVVVLVYWRGRLVLPPATRSGFLVPIVAGAAAACGVLIGIWALGRLTSQHWDVLDVATLPDSIAVVLVASLLGTAAEEIGWRGVVQPLLETRTGAIRAMIGTGLLFGVGHFYVASEGPLVYLLFVIGATAMSVIFGTLSAGRTIFGRTVAASIAHWFVNFVLLLFFSDGDSSAVWMAQLAAASALIAGFCVYRMSAGAQRQMQSTTLIST